MDTPEVARSYLYVPGDAPEELATALARGADAVVVDLEDAVPADGKETARKTVATWLRSVPAGAQVWVRINPGPLGHDDAREVVGAGLRGLCAARTESSVQLDALDAVLSTVEADAGLAPRAIAVAPMLETAGAILSAPAIARAPRVAWLQLDEADLQADLGLSLADDERELLWARSQVVAASAAAGLDAPVGAVLTGIADIDQLRSSTQALKRLGFRGRACVTADQLVVAHEVFTPTAAELDAAQDIVDRYTAALRDGLPGALDARGRPIDEAAVRAARRTLAVLA